MNFVILSRFVLIKSVIQRKAILQVKLTANFWSDHRRLKPGRAMNDLIAEQKLKRQKSRIEKYKDKKTEVLVSPELSVHVICTGARGLAKSLLIRTTHDKYLFNCGETTQKCIYECAPRLGVVDNIFFTYNSWSNIGGLMGFVMSNTDGLLHSSSIKIHGPRHVEKILEMTKFFSEGNSDQLAKIEYRGITNKQYEDEQVTVQYVNIFPSKSESRSEEESNSGTLQHPEDKLNIKNAMGFIITPKQLPSKVDIEKLVQLNEKSGSWVGKLVKGESVTLESGRVKPQTGKQPRSKTFDVYCTKKVMSQKLDSASELEKKRKRSENSSVSDLDSSVDITIRKKKPETSAEKLSKKQQKKQQKMEKLKEHESTLDTTTISQQLVDINKKLSNVLTKDDGYLKEIIGVTFKQMKEELLQSVSKRIEVLEGKLFEKDKENDKLKTEVKSLKERIEQQKDENEKMKKTIEIGEDKVKEQFNNLEQYGRRNNIRLSGIVETREETTEQTTTTVLAKLNERMPDLHLRREDIDIAHRLGKRGGNGSKRQIIVKFVSRMQKEKVVKNRRNLKGTGIFVNEDLTFINLHVLSCLRKKQPDEIDMAWSINGNLFYKTKMGDVKKLLFHEYQPWVDMPWP